MPPEGRPVWRDFPSRRSLRSVEDSNGIQSIKNTLQIILANGVASGNPKRLLKRGAVFSKRYSGGATLSSSLVARQKIQRNFSGDLLMCFERKIFFFVFLASRVAERRNSCL
jgi:hypothetical protein